MQIWPWLLGLFPLSSSEEDREVIMTQSSEHYHECLAAWKKVEIIHLRNLEKAEKERAEKMRKLYAVSQKSQSNGTVEALSNDRVGEGEEMDDGASPSKEGASNGVAENGVIDAHDGRDSPAPAPEDQQDIDLRTSSPETPTLTNLPTSSPVTPSPTSPCSPLHISQNCTADMHDTSLDSCSGGINGCHSDESVTVNGSVSQVESNEERDGDGVGGEGDRREEGGELEEDEEQLDEIGRHFSDELLKIDKDIPRCDRDYW